jgi:glycosyltransferase involved in cell wall biosynthesis
MAQTFQGGTNRPELPGCGRLGETAVKPVVLLACDFYLPGYKAGGPIRTLANMVDALGNEFSFKVITRNRDFSETKPYQGVQTGRWTKLGKAEVCYLSDRDLGPFGLVSLIRGTPHQLLYLNSFFSLQFSIYPLLGRRCGLVPQRPLVLAPRGEFASGALAVKPRKKRMFLRASCGINVHRDVIWQASSHYEQQDIIRQIGEQARVTIAPDVPPQQSTTNSGSAWPVKKSGHLHMVFLGRIARNKNLLGALQILAGFKGSAQLDIYGIQEDPHYWNECLRVMDSLPPGVTARFKGELPHDQVADVFSGADLFFMPSHGENFGHAILEALLAGCPVLISDRTPWRGLAESGAGWDLPLNDPEAFSQVLHKVAALGQEESRSLHNAALRFGRKYLADSQKVIEANRKLFMDVIESRPAMARSLNA